MDLEKLNLKLQEIGKHIPHKELKNPEVSSATIGWHLDHSLKVINNVSKALKKSDPEKYKGSFSFWKNLVLLSGRIPRGKARSPKSVLPPDLIEREDLQAQLKEAEKNISKYHELPGEAHFKHPFFKNLKRDETRRFLEIHTEHHLKIVREIIKYKNQ